MRNNRQQRVLTSCQLTIERSREVREQCRLSHLQCEFSPSSFFRFIGSEVLVKEGSFLNRLYLRCFVVSLSDARHRQSSAMMPATAPRPESAEPPCRQVSDGAMRLFLSPCRRRSFQGERVLKLEWASWWQAWRRAAALASSLHLIVEHPG